MVGLDIGTATVKAVRIEERGRDVVGVEARTFDARAEGILDEREFRNSVAGWLAQSGWDREEISAGLPQYLTTTQVSDFPAGASDGLADMVAYETRQLAGLSEEAFVHDYQVMPPRFGRRNPALIGICRESVARERADALLAAGINLVELSMNGTAVASAFCQLRS